MTGLSWEERRFKKSDARESGNNAFDEAQIVDYVVLVIGFPSEKERNVVSASGLPVKDVVIAFDIDGTLRDNTIQGRVVANERIRTLLIALSSMRNTKIMLWSGGGAGYAREVAAAMAIEQYVDVYEDKGYGGYDADGRAIFHTDLQPDIAFDDIREFDLGAVNLIVDENGFTPGYVPPASPR